MKIGKLFKKTKDHDEQQWCRCLEGQRFHFIDVTDMDEACGKDNEGQPRYVVELCEVDLDTMPDKLIKQSLDSCGWEDMLNEPPVIADALRSYGRRAPLHSVTTNNVGKGVAECRKESYQLCAQPGALEERLSKPANQLGSTAREFMFGDIHSAMARGVRAGDKGAELMAKMYGATEENIAAVASSPAPSGAVAAKISLYNSDLGKLSGGDPLAYTTGFMRGVSLGSMDGPRDKLARAYKDGFKHGVSVRLGHEQTPDWIK
jgi:hypothetical protein